MVIYSLKPKCNVSGMKKVLIVSLIVLGIGIHTALAGLSLGSMVNKNDLTLTKGSSGVFKVSFFNLGNERLYVDLDAEYPRELRVDIYPSSLVLDSEITTTPYRCDDCGWFVLKDGKTWVKTKPVYITVKVPGKITRNDYRIKLIATARTAGGGNKGGMRQTLSHVREINLNLYVPGKTVEVEEILNMTEEELFGGVEEEEEKEEYQEPTMGELFEKTRKEETVPTGKAILAQETQNIVNIAVIAVIGITVSVFVIKKLLG